MMFRWAALATLVAALPAAAQLGDGLTGRKLARAVEKAAAHPLGSEQNPVRATMPPGERAYLRRLRCADGNAPAFNRAGSTGIGPYRNILDLYTVQCVGASAVSIYVDMYHDHVETAAVPGFNIVEP